MISSMTAFSRKSEENPWGFIAWEVRTINHRYLDISLRLPENLRELEMRVREIISRHIHRGKVDVTLKFQWGSAFPVEFLLNKELVKRLAEMSHEVAHQFPSAQVNLMDILNWQGVLQSKEMHSDKINQNTLDLLQKALQDIVEMRQREGASLTRFLKESLVTISQQAKIIRENIPEAIKNERNRILVRFEEMKVMIDRDRLEQEMLWMIQKSDITEELVRLESHLKEVQRVLEKGGEVGRRLDFLMQELHRETNTIASKSNNSSISQAAIEIKVLIEQMREQVQNIE